MRQRQPPVSRNAAVAEVGRTPARIGPLAFAAWLGVHAVLLTTARAKIDAFLEWAGDYFDNAHVDPVLDRPDQINIDWNADEKQEQSRAKKQASANS